MPVKVVLYNPDSVFYTMPLALLAIASSLDPKRYEVKIVDGRLDNNAHDMLVRECRDAIVLGITVLTGAPIRDALAATRKVKQQYPHIISVWGGWHPSLFPAETLEEQAVDVVVDGQGEIPFAALLDAVVSGAGFDMVRGLYFRKNGTIFHAGQQHFTDINLFPALNYGLLPVKRYFSLKKRKQLDYISSQGCRFRCSFCADPAMYQRGWYGYHAERVGAELEALWKRYRFEDVNFQDETFFTYRERVAGIAEQFLRRGLGFTWFGTMRADQGVRMDDGLYKLCKRSGLRKVMIGVEAGSQEMMDWMKKDIKIGQVYESAEKCLRHGIAVIFNFILGFPHETEESIAESLRVARRLRKMSPDFELGIFYFKPYPGNAIADQLLQEGYLFPQGLEEWAAFDYVGSSSEWISEKQKRQIEHFRYYQRIGYNRTAAWMSPVRRLARWRCERHNYLLPVERMIGEFIKPPAKLS